MPTVRIYVDFGGSNAIPHVAFSLENGALLNYFGYAPGRSALIGAGRVSEGLNQPIDPSLAPSMAKQDIAWESAEIQLTQAQYDNMRAEVERIAANPGTYNAAINNCAHFVSAVLRADGVAHPITGSGFDPTDFIPAGEYVSSRSPSMVFGPVN
jgi:hypothetical protein